MFLCPSGQDQDLFESPATLRILSKYVQDT